MQANNSWDNIVSMLNLENETIPKTILFFTSDITLLLAIVLSARTKDEIVNKFCKNLLSLPTDDLTKLSLEEIKGLIKNINFYNNKAVTLFELLKKFSQSNDFIYSKENLLSIKGIGEKTANVFLNLVTQEPLIGVDVHVERVVNRVENFDNKPAEYIQKFLTNNMKNTLCIKMCNHVLVKHGREVCKAREPLCSTCAINHKCSWFKLKLTR